MKSDVRATDSLAEKLEALILSGGLENGQKLPSERELMEEYGLSRTVVREAIKNLEGKKLVISRPRHRPTVNVPTHETVIEVLGNFVKNSISNSGSVRDIFDTRIFFEAGLVRFASLHAQKADIAKIRDALARNETSVDDAEAFYDSDDAFHAVFYAIPGNPFFPTIHRAFFQWLEWHWRQMPREPKRNRRNFLAHKAIVEAILHRDPDGAEKRLREHLEDSWLQMEKILQSHQ